MARVKEERPKEFTQYVIPEPEKVSDAITQGSGADVVLAAGEFISPNYKKYQRGWKVDSDGNAEFQSVRVSHGFGGDGSDGKLEISSGTTTIDLAGAEVVTKNYSFISIVGTGALAFSNPNASGSFVILRSQGGCVLTSTANPLIDVRSLGATAGTGGAAATSGTDGTKSARLVFDGSVEGKLGNTSGAGGTGGVILPSTWLYATQNNRTLFIVSASGGGGGGGGANSSGGVAGGAGGNGGRVRVGDCSDCGCGDDGGSQGCRVTDQCAQIHGRVLPPVAVWHGEGGARADGWHGD